MTISSLNFGKVNTREGKITLTPVIQGIDFEKIVDSLLEVKKVALVKEEGELKQSANYSKALGELRKKIEEIHGAAQPLRNSLDPFSSNVFHSLGTSIQSTNPLFNANSIVSVVSSFGAQPGGYSLTVNKLATNDFINASADVTDPTVAQASVMAGNLTINGTDVAIPAQASLNQVITAINSKQSLTQVTASAVKVNSSQYCLTLSATTTGSPIQLLDDQSGNLLDALNISSSSATVEDLSADLVYNNLPITRPTNQINDLIPYVTVNLLSSAPSTPLTITLNTDIESMKQGVRNFVTAYNNYQEFYAVQTQVNPATGKSNANAVLINDSLLRLTSSYLLDTASGMAFGIPYTEPNSLENLGITLTDHKTFILNEKNLDTFLRSNPLGLEKICGFYIKGDNDQVTVLERPQTLGASFINPATRESYPLTVTYQKDSSGVGSATFSMNNITEAAVASNGCISSSPGSIFSGFSFFCDMSSVGDNQQLQTVFTVSQGVVDQIARTLGDYLKPDGSFAVALKNLSDKQINLQKQMKEIEKKMGEERERLTKVYARVAQSYEKMESSIREIRDFNESFYRK